MNEVILVVEDDKAVKNLLNVALKSNEYKVISTAKGSEAITLTATENPALILLDLGLEDVDGTVVIKKVREWTQVPIIVVSARGQEKDKIEALDYGADDYITKPFSTNELLARVRACIRKSKTDVSPHSEVFISGDLKIDYSMHMVTLAGVEVHFTNIEYKLITLLSQNAGKVLTHNYIINHVWGTGGADSQTLRVFMAGLRRKLEKDITKQTYIRTEVGVGYRFI